MNLKINVPVVVKNELSVLDGKKGVATEVTISGGVGFKNVTFKVTLEDGKQYTLSDTEVDLNKPFEECMNPPMSGAKIPSLITDGLPTKEQIDIVSKADNISDYEAVGNEMAALLMDTDVSTYDMYEDLAAAYLNHADNEVFISGLNAACRILLWKDVPEIAKHIIENVAEDVA